MAQIIYLHHEDISRALIESALQTREIGFTGASGYEELILKAESGSYYHFASLERLNDNVAAASSGAKLIGFAPPAGMSSTDVQGAIEEIRASVGGGSLVGSGTAGRLAVWASGTTVGNSSILAEASSKLNFSGDAIANLYRSAASTMKTDAAFIASGLLSALASFAITGTITFAADASANLYRSASATVKTDGAFIAAGLLSALANFAVTGSITWDGDAGAQIHRFTTGMLLATGDFFASGDLISGGDVEANDQLMGNRVTTAAFYNLFGVNDNSAADGTAINTFTNLHAKSVNVGDRTFIDVLIKPTINNTSGNTSTTIDLLRIDSINTSLIGTTVNLLNMLFGGADRFKFTSDGELILNCVSGNLFSFKASGVEKFAMTQNGVPGFFGTQLTGANTVGLGTTSPANAGSTPVTWIEVGVNSGTGCIPVWPLSA